MLIMLIRTVYVYAHFTDTASNLSISQLKGRLLTFAPCVVHIHVSNRKCKTSCVTHEKQSTKRVQISDKAAHYLRIARIRNLESQLSGDAPRHQTSTDSHHISSTQRAQTSIKA